MLEKADMTTEDVDFFVFHQANARIIDLAVRKYHIPPEKYYKNIRTTATPPLPASPWSSASCRDLGKVGPGTRVLLVTLRRRPHLGRRAGGVGLTPCVKQAPDACLKILQSDLGRAAANGRSI